VIRQKGLALVLVLWVLSLLTIMAGSFALSMRREASIVAGIRNNARAMAVAESGIAMAEMMLLNPDPNKRWRADGSIYQIISADAKVRVRLLSETGKIDINKADQTLLQGLMTQAPVDAELQTRLVNAILDWRDKDDLVHINGAEKKEYQDAGLSYQPGNKPFQTIEELQLVLGMNESVFEWIEALITVYSGQPQVSVELATKEVLQVIPGLDAGLVDSYIAARLESAINDLPVPPFPSSSGQNNPGGQHIVLTLVSEALLDDESSAVISAVIKQSDETGATPFQVLKWQRITANDASLFTDAMSELLVKQYAEPELNN
jgi:general secretion pathway protein K